jgi:hypothetical protein
MPRHREPRVPRRGLTRRPDVAEPSREPHVEVGRRSDTGRFAKQFAQRDEVGRKVPARGALVNMARRGWWETVDSADLVDD